MMQQLWLVTVPNNKDSPDRTFETLRLNVPNCKLYRFEIPNLVVGTLDSLITLSDDLTKINSQVEVKCILIIIYLRDIVSWNISVNCLPQFIE